MKRIQEKVRDIVEVRPYENLIDFTIDPVKTFNSYFLTDATSELMAKWVDAIAGLRGGKGSTLALAGYRGVGKSHFLATLGAIISMPELRLRISDSHVAASAQRLMRRHYPLAYVRRGTGETLFDELKVAVKPVLGPELVEAAVDVRDLLEAATDKGSEMPLVLLIDTALERGTRVSRDDGPFLAEIAEAANGLNVFVGVVLDDDIAGADGVNSAISRVFAIDYLDPEHLYTVVNTHVFPKSAQKQSVLHDIYEYFRMSVPGFRWSEQRFAALYPLHPAILEVAPFVRLYVHDFALLGFASAAGERILGRPANSLIGLDEVFDKAERSLRKIEELKEGFAAYDKLNADVVSGVPVMQRLQAKLVLKALLLLSLDGQGTTAAEIAASMLIFDENEPERAVTKIEGWIRSFAEALPGDIRIDADEGRSERYAFRLTSRDDLNRALDEKAAAVPADVVPAILHRFFRDRFVDSTFAPDKAESGGNWMDCTIRWRGTDRPGRMLWSDRAFGGNAPAPPVDTFTDWEVLIDLNNGDSPVAAPPPGVSHVIWKPAQLRPDEIDVIRRYHVLSTDSAFREGPGDEKRASLHAHSVSVEQIVNRLLLEDGKLVIEGFDYNFTDEAQAAKNLSDLFSIMLEPLFETRYAEHPFFTQHLEMEEVGPLVADLYSGTRLRLPEVQEKAKVFALPLGLVRLENGYYQPEQNEGIAASPAVSIISHLIEAAEGGFVPLNRIYSELHKEPFGLTREVQHLLLTSLVAQRQVDFITSAGDRINRRSLDLKIIWEDITAVAKSAAAAHSAQRVLPWARVFAERDGLNSIQSQEDRASVEAGLRKWIAEWQAMRIVERFDELPDEGISAGAWKLATDCARILGAVADNIALELSGSISLDECLNRIADAFSGSMEQFERAQSQLAVVDSFIKGAETRAEILSYLSLCGYTDDEEIEETREQLYQVIDRSFTTPSDASNREMGYLWIKFQRDYAELFARRHDAFYGSAGLRQSLGEMEQSEKWWLFENLSTVPCFDQTFWEEARRIRGQILQASCKANVQETLKDRPFCACSFHLEQAARIEALPARLERVVSDGLLSFSSTFSTSKDIAGRLANEAETNTAAKSLAERIGRADPFADLNREEMAALYTAFSAIV